MWDCMPVEVLNSGLVRGPSSVELISTYNNQFLYVLAIYSVQLMKVHEQKHYNSMEICMLQKIYMYVMY